MLASACFLPCLLTFYSNDQSLFPFLKSWFLNYSCMFTFYGLATYSYSLLVYENICSTELYCYSIGTNYLLM